MLIALGDADKLKSPFEANTIEETPRGRGVGEANATRSKNRRKRTGPSDKTYPLTHPAQMIYGLSKNRLGPFHIIR
jgi:hypothetical protein